MCRGCVRVSATFRLGGEHYSRHSPSNSARCPRLKLGALGVLPPTRACADSASARAAQRARHRPAGSASVRICGPSSLAAFSEALFSLSLDEEEEEADEECLGDAPRVAVRSFQRATMLRTEARGERGSPARGGRREAGGVCVPVAVEYVSVLVGVKVLVYVLVLLGVCVVVVPVCE
ncbi:hypothetical protein B0H14DRAFT_2950472 [Mycena olivaceomarginata]|nr:hypothetical protein B0H14DRAFT_2950472 [Mycena olivaceomarginata]